MSMESQGEQINIRGDIMGPEHGDIKYLKRDDIGAVMAKGLSETYQANPKNPVEFFAKWLLNYGKTDGASQEVCNCLNCSFYFLGYHQPQRSCDAQEGTRGGPTERKSSS